MTNEELKLKVINAQAKVEKKAAILWKHRQQLDKLITKGADDYAIRSKHSDIGEASKKLSEAQASPRQLEGKIRRENKAGRLPRGQCAGDPREVPRRLETESDQLLPPAL